MKLSILMIAAFLVTSASALAFSDGTYRCKNSAGDMNTYKFEMISMGGVTAPFIEATLRYRKNPEDKNSPVTESTTKGFAVISTTEDTELLALNNLRFEFVKNELSNCKQ